MGLNLRKNRIFIAVIFLLMATLAGVSVALAERGSEYNRKYIEAVAELERAQSSLSEIEGQNDSYASQLEAERREKERLQEENAGLKEQIANLKAKKAEEARKLAAQQQQQQQQSSQPVTLPPATKACYLTFDDGPCDNTLQILDILSRYGVKATFFVKGTGKAEYLKNIYNAGHAVGLHTYSHVYESLYASDDAYFTDLNAVSAVVEQQLGIKSMLIRFPGGSSNVVSKKYCQGIMSRLSASVTAAGYAYFDWNVDSGDAAGASTAKIISNVINQASKKSGAICVLMHDIKKNTTAALPSVIEGLQQRGFCFEPLTAESFGFHHGVNN